MENLNFDQRKAELFKLIDAKQNGMETERQARINDVQEMRKQFEQSVQIIIDLSKIVAAFNNFILEIEEKIKTMQTIPTDGLENLRQRMSDVSNDLNNKIKMFKEALGRKEKIDTGIFNTR